MARKNSAGNILRQTVKNHDPMGRLKSYNVILTDPEAPNNPGYSYAYENDGNKVTVTDWLGRQSVREQIYNGSVKTIKETDPAGNIVAYFVNEKGRGNLDRKKETVKLADGTVKTYETHYEYNAFGKVEKITDPQGLVSTFAYNGQGNLSRTVDAENNVVQFAYDNLGRKKTTTRYAAKGGPAMETHFTYNKVNLLETIRDSKGNVTRYEYDARRRPRQVTYPDGSVQAYAYGKREVDGVLSRTTTETQRNGVTVETVYDANNRVWKRFINSPTDIEGTSEETYTYDPLSRLEEASNDFSTLRMKYDHLDRLKGEFQNGQWTHYTYQDQADTHSLLQTFQYPSATETGGNGRVMERDFDILGRLSAIRDQAGDVHVAGFTYEGRGYRYHSKHYNNGDVINYAYTQGRRLQGKETKNKNSALINHYVYGYNNVGMKTYEQRNHDSGKGDVYAYDGVSRLTGITFDAPDPTAAEIPDTGKSWAASYDGVDNILSMVNVQEGKTKTITPQIPTNSVYEKLNQYATFDGAILSYDENGNTSRKGLLKFYYDYRNQLVRILDGIKTTQYTYDVMGRRIRKDVAGQVTNYFYSGNQVMEERDGSGNILKQYIYGNGIDELLRIDVYENGTVTSYFVHTNAVGSVTAITDADGNIVERISYDAFGNASFTNAAGNPIASSSIGNEILFQGRRYDKESNLYYYRARHYDPVMGRFLQNDPMGYYDSMNLYQAFNMNGVNFVDPKGEWALGVHEEITSKAFSAKASKLFKMATARFLGFGFSKRKYFKAGLIAGSTWPDMPDGALEALKVLDIKIFPKFSLELQEKPNKELLTYRSHFGDIQHWHAMKSGNNTNEQVAWLIKHDIINWLMLARELLFPPSEMRPQKEGFKKYITSGHKMIKGYKKIKMAGQLIGMAMHLIEDSYCPAHAERDKKTFDIIQFFDYGKQDKEWHHKNDEINDRTKRFYLEAIDTATEIMEIILNPKEEKVRSKLSRLLDSKLQLKK